MLSQVKTELDPVDFDIVIASDLVDEAGDFYSLTFKDALDEQLGEEYLESCQYKIGNDKRRGRIIEEFIGWTKTKVIFAIRGMFYEDSFLTSVPRNPQ